MGARDVLPTHDVLLSGWGGTPASRASVVEPDDEADVARAMECPLPRGLIARGLGRSYGDAAQNAGGRVLDLTRLSQIRRLDATAGSALVQGGTSLDAIMRAALPLGWFVPVSPGTRYVTVGGAVAADIHGKNHHRDGAFAGFVDHLVLETPGGRLTVGPDADREVFWATAGGMGLTGTIVEAQVRLRPVETGLMVVDTERTIDVDDVMARMTADDDRYEYSVAWVDCLARGASLGRSVLTRGRHARLEEVAPSKRKVARRFDPHVRLRAPAWSPSRLISLPTVAAFNEVWFRKAPRRRVNELHSLARFFHPLDGVEGWNRMYGRRGFVQYQYVVPDGADAVVRQTLERLSAARCPSFLAVLKRFGPADPGPLSFPMPGWTLAVDLPAWLGGLPALLDGFDELVCASGGRVYLAKDARLRPELVPAMYPRLDEWRGVQARVDPGGVLNSDLARRLDLLGRS